MQLRRLAFKVATEPWEFEAIHRLNYETFVEEIPQHARNPERRLVDKFHRENSYIIALNGDELAGMVCFRGKRPFSLDSKLPGLDACLPAARSVCEVRLLAVARQYRRGEVTPGLIDLLVRNLIEIGFDCAIISGTTHQLKFYRHLGFVPFGPLVGFGDATFQPMYLLLEDFQHSSGAELIMSSKT